MRPALVLLLLLPTAACLGDPAAPASERPTFCGNGQVEDGEQCDAGTEANGTVAGGCRVDCTFGCGDGHLDPRERCDRGSKANGLPDAGCSSECVDGVCGDGRVDADEQCDGGNATSSATCDAECRFLCGNGAVDPGEACDWADPNEPIGSCEFTCRRVQPCGNGRADPGELCDPSAGDGSCTSECTPICGDGQLVGFHEPGGEICDDGPDAVAALSSCDPTSCRFARCGDGLLDRTEPCDDGFDSVTCTEACTLRAGCSAVDVVAGWWTLWIRLQDGTLLASGGNNAFALGLPDDQTSFRRPTPVPWPRFARIAAGELGGAGITADGRLYTWGGREKGQRGLGTAWVEPAPAEVSIGVPVVDVAVGAATTWVVDAEGGLWSFGLDVAGALGLGAAEKAELLATCVAGPCVPTPVRIGPPGVKFRAVAGYSTTGVALDEQGRIWGWGAADAGSIGPTSAAYEPACPAGGGSTLGCEPTPKLLDEALEGVTEVATGAGQTVLLRDGRLFGLGVELQLGLPPAPDGLIHRTAVPVELGAGLLSAGDRFERVASGDHWVFAITREGRLFGAGGNGYGQLGLGRTAPDELFTEILVPGAVRAATASWGHSAILLRDGRVLTMGFTDEIAPGRIGREPTPTDPATKAARIQICP